MTIDEYTLIGDALAFGAYPGDMPKLMNIAAKYRAKVSPGVQVLIALKGGVAA